MERLTHKFWCIKRRNCLFTIFLKHSCLLKCDEFSCSSGAKRDSSPNPIKTWEKRIWLHLIQLGSFGRVSDIQCTDSSSEWLWNLMLWKEMHLFAYEILSKFQAFEVEQIQRQVCSVYLHGFCKLHGVCFFVLVGLFVITRNLHFFDPENLLKLYSAKLIFFECSFNYHKVEQILTFENITP